MAQRIMDHRHFFENVIGVQKTKWSGNQGIGRCPLPNHEDRNPSFSMNGSNGQCRCRGCHFEGNAVTLAKACNIDNYSQFRSNTSTYSNNHISNEYKPINTIKSHSKDIDEVENMEEKKRLYEELKTKYQINKHGSDLMIIGKDKYIGENDKGETVWIYPNGIKVHKKYWMKEASTDMSNQILGLEQLDSSSPTLYIVEGEKDWYNFPSWMNAVTFSAGAGAVPNDLSEVIYEDLKEVICLGDNDDAGFIGDGKIGNTFKRANPELSAKQIKWDVDLPEKFDVSDALERGMDFFKDAISKTIDIIPIEQQTGLQVQAATIEKEAPSENEILKDFVIMTGDKCDTMEATPVEWIVENILPSKFLCCVAGTTGSKKSMWTMQLALSIANGNKDFLGNLIPNQLKVLFVDTEVGQDELLRRYKGITKHMDWQGHDNWMMVSKRGFLSDVWNAVDLLCHKHQADLVIIDCLYNSTLVQDFSKSTGMTKVTDAVTQLREKYNNTFLLVHHFNKGNHDSGLMIDRMSGSAVLQNWVEFQILMLKTNVKHFHLWHIAKTRGVDHDESVLGLKWDDYKFQAVGVIEEYRQFLITEEKKEKWLMVIEDCPESFTTEEWLNVFNSKFKEYTERTGRTWLSEASSTPMVNKVKHGYYKKGLGLIDISNVDK